MSKTGCGETGSEDGREAASGSLLMADFGISGVELPGSAIKL
jgi:hypothetical protein